MHIPNGFLSDPVCAATAVAATAALGWSVAQVRRTASAQCGDARTPMLTPVVAAGIFAAQMVNFNVAHGTSGHMLGGALAAILLGPWAGMLAMAAVLAVQCLLLGDGGLSALGANALNMAVIAPLVGAAVYGFVTRRTTGKSGMLLGAALAGWTSVMAAAVACSGELALSGTYAFSGVLVAMSQVHAVIGACEAGLTVGILAAVLAAAPAMQAKPQLAFSWPSRRVIGVGLGLALAVAGLLAPWASTAPDGLERVALDLRFDNLAVANWLPVLTPEESAWPALATSVVGMLGVLAVFAAAAAANRAALARVRQ